MPHSFRIPRVLGEGDPAEWGLFPPLPFAGILVPSSLVFSLQLIESAPAPLVSVS